MPVPVPVQVPAPDPLYFTLADPDVLEEVLCKNLEQTVDFYVYNTETDTVRTATLMPNLKWGGRGCLGAEIGHGYLHGLPQKCCKTNGGLAAAGLGLPWGVWFGRRGVWMGIDI